MFPTFVVIQHLYRKTPGILSLGKHFKNLVLLLFSIYNIALKKSILLPQY